MQKKILIIDDVALIRQTIREILVPPISAMAQLTRLLDQGAIPESPYMIEEIDQGGPGVAMIEKAALAGEHYDIAIVDMSMPPGIDGAETIRRIRKVDPGLHIIICTGHAEADLNATRDEHGLLPPVIFKPFQAEKLVSLVEAGQRRF